MAINTNRRSFIGVLAAGGAALQMRYAGSAELGADAGVAPGHRGFEDLYRAKWSWDRVARGAHGTNCAGTCAFNVYIKNGVVWREEQQGMYEASKDFTCDFEKADPDSVEAMDA